MTGATPKHHIQKYMLRKKLTTYTMQSMILTSTSRKKKKSKVEWNLCIRDNVGRRKKYPLHRDVYPTEASLVCGQAIDYIGFTCTM